MFLKIFLQISIFLMWVAPVFAQKESRISATIEKDRILLGEQVKLVVTANLEKSKNFSFRKVDSIPHFEILNVAIDSQATGQLREISATYTICSFDSGHWEIPPFVISSEIKTTAIPIDIVFTDDDPSAPYHGIKEIIEVKATEKKNKWMWIVAAIIITSIIVLLKTRKKKKPITRAVSSFNAYEEAKNSLQQLQRQELSPKEYYATLSDIFRRYIAQKKGIGLQQDTTIEALGHLEKLNLPSEMFGDLKQVLLLADFVKFAKYIPPVEEQPKIMTIVSNSIDYVEKMNE